MHLDRDHLQLLVLVMTGGLSRGAKTLMRTPARRSSSNLASTPDFVRRSLGLIDPAAVSEPVNRAQRRALAKASATSTPAPGEALEVSRTEPKP